MKIRSRSAVVLLFCFISAAASAATSAEARTARYFESVRNNPNLLLVFLRDMPKGGDLHNHLIGQHLCGVVHPVGRGGWRLCRSEDSSLSAPDLASRRCGPSSDGFSDPGLYATMIDAFSMRNWQYSGQSGHDHFFDTFGKYCHATQGTTGKMLAETAARAASQHEVYQELMYPPGRGEIDALAKSVGVGRRLRPPGAEADCGRSAEGSGRGQRRNCAPTKPNATRSYDVARRKPIPAARSSSDLSTSGSCAAQRKSWSSLKYSPAFFYRAPTRRSCRPIRTCSA